MTTTAARPADEIESAPARRGTLSLRLPPEWILTSEALACLSARNEGLRPERGEHGELVLRMAAGGRGPKIAVKIGTRLDLWSDDDGGGSVEDGTAGYDLTPADAEPHSGPMRNPDLSWVSPAQLESIGGAGPIRGFWPLCPVFVVEIVSPEDDLSEQQDKMEMWIEHGAQLGWLVDPASRSLWLYRSDRAPQHLERPGLVDGEPILHGFAMDFAPIWQIVDDAESVARG